ncbi:hypothetical protein [Psychromonas sp. SA13A]|uniref:hypothetical protein n=1 Tax=Psychromonas sp. SA13A TaxID=2686346 RepID=UPI00140B9CF0|nr:hypothetical protein [Psychromonas sp. SA13A]
MKTIYIHIGDAKTGSSTIQRFLTINREYNLGLGVDYVNVGLLASEGIAQHKLAFSINNDTKRYHKEKNQLYGSLTRHIINSKSNKYIISSEGFCSLRTIEEIKDLKEQLPNNVEIKIIAYLRCADKWIESWYSQVVKNFPFTQAKFSDFLKRNQDPAYNVILKYAQVFGNQNVIVRAFDKRSFYQNSLIDDVCKIIGIDALKNSEVDDENISPDVHCIELLRVLNEKLIINNSERVTLYQQIIKSYKNTKDKSFFSEEERENIRLKYKVQINEIEKNVILKEGALRLLYD